MNRRQRYVPILRREETEKEIKGGRRDQETQTDRQTDRGDLLESDNNDQ
jgi:hypothetical protein